MKIVTHAQMPHLLYPTCAAQGRGQGSQNCGQKPRGGSPRGPWTASPEQQKKILQMDSSHDAICVELRIENSVQ